MQAVWAYDMFPLQSHHTEGPSSILKGCLQVVTRSKPDDFRDYYATKKKSFPQRSDFPLAAGSCLKLCVGLQASPRTIRKTMVVAACSPGRTPVDSALPTRLGLEKRTAPSQGSGKFVNITLKGLVDRRVTLLFYVIDNENRNNQLPIVALPYINTSFYRNFSSSHK